MDKKDFRCCLETFSTEEILKIHIKDSLKVSDKQEL